jgi:hypothetical protein
MKNIFRISHILLFLFGCKSGISFAEVDLDCEKSLKYQERNVLDIITLYGKNYIQNVVMGSYNDGKISGYCNHNIVVKYDIPDEEASSETHKRLDTIFRYFNLNELGNPFKPPVIMHARQPIVEPYENGTNGDKMRRAPYDCEQRFELEDRFARWYEDSISPSTWAGSMVVPRNRYPFCEYHIFLMYPKKGAENQNSEIWFTHVKSDETWYWHEGADPFPQGIEFQGRIIPDSDLPRPH